MMQSDETDFDVTNVERLRYFAACLAQRPPVAAFDLIRDSQTRALIDRVRRDGGAPRIVDLGCGQLRLLHALLTELPDVNWTYYGVDIDEVPITYAAAFLSCAEIEAPGQRWSVGPVADLHTTNQVADLCIICNVLHEVSIGVTAELLEHARRILAPSGSLLLMDMGFLPEGEPRFVPLTDSDLDILLPKHAKLSFVSKRGTPIIFAESTRPDIPPFFMRRAALREWMAYKRDAFAFLGLGLAQPDHSTILTELQMTGEATFDFLYLNTVIANAAYRVVEEDMLAPRSVSKDEFSAAGRDILRLIEKRLFSEHGSYATTIEVFDELGSFHRYDALDAALALLGRPQIPSVLQHVPLVFQGRLEPSEFFDYIVDAPDKRGLYGPGYLMDSLVQYGSDWHAYRG